MIRVQGLRLFMQRMLSIETDEIRRKARPQVNVLLSQRGKPKGSFVTLDLVRLPLGILSGVRFIDVGAILRKACRSTLRCTAAAC
jgi:hypothetical protein